MNYKNLMYNLGYLAKSTSLSEQCVMVRDLFLAAANSDLERLHRVFRFLDGTVEPNTDTVEWLRKGLTQGYVLEKVSVHEEALFWYELHLHYPKHAKLLFLAADLAFLDKWPNALEMFFQAFDLDPSLVFAGMEGDVWDAIQQSPFRLQYELILLKDAVATNDEEWLDEELPELRAEWAGNPEALRLIDAAIRPT